MKVEVYNIKGEKTDKKIDLNESIFEIEPNDHVIYLDVKRIMADRRQGTHKAKERSDIVGSQRKLRRQKGIGSARVGSIKNPIFRGGGRVFGPRPRDYSFKLNKKVKLIAKKSALSYKLSDKKILIVEDFSIEAPKTKEYKNILKNLKADGRKNLMVISEENNNIILSSKNISNSYICTPEKLNTYNILNNDLLILTESAVKVITKIFN
ncbi:MAG: 50S ribosomal protein L4 [Bacteroidota bacterium]|nr:50S ribosomal protein L4 [Bacteroidota bacterium]